MNCSVYLTRKMSSSVSEAIENEWYIVRYSGETPEIAYNSAIYYLTRAKDGPQISLSHEQVSTLKKAAADRYLEIVLRDLLHENYDKPIYRGLARSITNYNRFCKFCERQGVDGTLVRSEAANALIVFLETELEQVRGNSRSSIINCTKEELQRFAEDLGVNQGTRFDGIMALCPVLG